MAFDKITEKVLGIIDGEGFKEEGAYNVRYNGTALCHGDSEKAAVCKNYGDVEDSEAHILLALFPENKIEKHQHSHLTAKGNDKYHAHIQQY